MTTSTHDREGNAPYIIDNNNRSNQQRNNIVNVANEASNRGKLNDEYNTPYENKSNTDQNNMTSNNNNSNKMTTGDNCQNNEGQVDRTSVLMSDSANNKNSDNDKRKAITNVVNTNSATTTQIQLPEMYAVQKPIFNDHST